MASVSPAPALSGLENALGKGAKLRDIFLWSMLVVVFVFVATVLLLWFRAWLKYSLSAPSGASPGSEAGYVSTARAPADEMYADRCCDFV
ncbi:hypothetical protein NUU61_000939 [Penicillium alfredii]|uniref:Uncharacterized protein n=1 Tax=Penicillium alfredii TaxID=1506179 RepID=A0A9W9GAI2_9EURO|nr:uncharacterized protein NUU61_000939 [Penicillium alfredii]KAJ5115180.1 hypothetical protein NUU61_000939 [Penicillium alfredii]